MNVQEYILSGVVESYVLGLSGDEERAEFERMCAAHSEVRAARDAFEQLLEKQLVSQAIAPPSNLKSKIIADIEIENDKRQGKKVVSMKKLPSVQSGWLRYVAAASVITKNVPEDALAIGRARQENKEGYAKRLRKP